MTTKNTIQPAPAGYRLSDPPPREPDEVTAFDHIYKPGSHQRLARHFGNPETTLVEYDRWIVASPQDNRAEGRRPDLLVAFNVSPGLYAEHNGYLISEQGKPPDFVMEVASPSTASNDTGVKRDEYAALGISEYWRRLRPETYWRSAGRRLVPATAGRGNSTGDTTRIQPSLGPAHQMGARSTGMVGSSDGGGHRQLGGDRSQKPGA